MVLSGTEKVGDRWAYVIDATPTEGPPEKMYFDTQTGLLVRRDMAKYVGGATQPDPTTDEGEKLGALFAPTTDEYIQVEMKRRCIPGLALVVIKNGEVVKMNGFGFANLKGDVPVTPDTVFDLASVTKQITATAIMRLVEQGKIELDDPIIQYLPDSPSHWNGITIRHLLTNTSGLRVVSFVRPHSTTASSFKFLAGEPLRFKPGSEYFYSSAGFFLLGMIIEKVGGSRYSNFLAEQFFKPLGMNSTTVVGHSVSVKNRAACYTVQGGKPGSRGCYEEGDELPASYGVLSTVIFKIEGGKLICMERQLAYRYTGGEFFLDRDEFTPTGELKVKGKTVSWRTQRLKYLGEGMDVQTRVTLTSDNEAVLEYVGEISEGDQPLMLVPLRVTLKKQL